MLFGRCLDVPRVVKDDHEEGRGDSEGENCKRYAVEKHDGGNAANGQDANQQIDQAIGNELLNIGNVAGDALDEVALLLLTMPV